MSFGLDFTKQQVGQAVQQLNQFVGAVLEADGLYEIRPVPFTPGGSIWAAPGDFERHVSTLMAWNRDASNPYFSLNLRRAVGGRKGKDSLPGSLVVADFDSGIDLGAARAKVRDAGLPDPTAIVCTSPDHWHFYWRLDQRLPDLETHRRIQRALAETLDSCRSVCSHQQVMRLPGPFCNVKPERPEHPRVELIECQPERVYPIAMFPVAPPEPPVIGVPFEELAVAIEKGSLSDSSRALIEQGTLFPKSGRMVSIYRAAGDMHARGWGVEDATRILVAVGQRLGIETAELSDIPRQVRNAFAKPWTPGYATAELAVVDVESLPTRRTLEEEPYDSSLESLPLPLPPSLPDRPAIALGHGVIGDFMRRVEMETEAHPVAIAMQLMIAFGNCVGRSPHTMVGKTRHGINLFGLVIGNTGRGRKGTGGDVVVDIIGYADAHWAQHCRSPNLVSGEGVIDAMRDPVLKYLPVKNGAPGEFETHVIEPGVDDKRLLIVCPEFVAALHAGRREASTLSQTLREAWDGKTLRTMAKNAGRTATDPHLSIIGHVTRQELLRATRETDVFGGLFNRFIFVLSDRARELPHGGDLEDLGPLPDTVRRCVEHARTVQRMMRSAEANRLWEEEYHRLTTVHGPEVIRAVLSRGEAQVLRLSMVMALMAGRSTIERDDLEAALDFWRYSEASARGVFDGGEDRTFTRAVELIQANPGITRTAIHAKLGWRVPASDFIAALSRVQAAGLAVSKVTATRGRPSERWYPAGGTSRGGKKENFPVHPAEAYPAFPDASATADPPGQPAALPPGRYAI
jgi:hypothetical protein